MIDFGELKEVVKGYYVEKLFQIHVETVVDKAEWLLEKYPEADREVVIAACYLHDVVHPTSGYEADDHNIASASKAREILSDFDVGEGKMESIVECIKCHRSSRPPAPDSIEAKIVASSDNLAHFDNYEFLANFKSEEWANRKLKRDISKDFMLPEAIDYARKKRPEIIND